MSETVWHEFWQKPIIWTSKRRGFSVLGISIEIPNLKLDDILQKLSSGKYELVLRKKKRKKSLTANAYMWVLCDEISKVLHTKKDAVYKQAILNVGVYIHMACVERAWERTKAVWESRGLGYFCQETERNRGWISFHAYVGSSAYSAWELSRVIDELVQEAENLGIDTLSSRERRQLMMKWSKEHGNSEGTENPTFSDWV